MHMQTSQLIKILTFTGSVFKKITMWNCLFVLRFLSIVKKNWSYTVVKRIIKYMFYTFNSSAMQMLDENKISGDANPTQNNNSKWIILTRNSKNIGKRK